MHSSEAVSSDTVCTYMHTPVCLSKSFKFLALYIAKRLYSSYAFERGYEHLNGLVCKFAFKSTINLHALQIGRGKKANLL